MGRRFCIVLEHDGENPVRNDFICELDDNYYFYLKSWEDLYTNKMGKYPEKKISIKTKKLSDSSVPYCWGINEIIPQIEAVKQEIEVDTQLDEEDKKSLFGVIDELQRLHDLAMSQCREHSLDPEKCYLMWWIDY